MAEKMSRLTQFEMQAGTLDVALNQRRIQFNALVEISQSILSAALQVCESGSEVQSETLELSQVAELQSLDERRRSLLIAIACLLAHCQ
jgi:pantothenate synthetase